MDSPRAWSLAAMGGKRQYAGNLGYEDNPRSVYRYDSNVANHLNVAVGDLALIRDREHLLGIAQIEGITSAPGSKTMIRCPECGNGQLKERVKKQPRFRCGNGHEFGVPREDVVNVMNYEAHYAGTFVGAPDAVPVGQIKAAAPRRSDQLSIEEIDVDKLEHSLVRSFPATRAVLGAFYQAKSLGPEEATAADELPIIPANGTPPAVPYMPSLADTRRSVLREIKQRRGQQKFRKALLERYGSVCLISQCSLLDVLEAAHIWPYRSEDDNHVENGLLLRADLHTLFDLDLIAIHPESLVIDLAPALCTDPTYAAFHGLKLTTAAAARPGIEPLAKRWAIFNAKWAA